MQSLDRQSDRIALECHGKGKSKVSWIYLGFNSVTLLTLTLVSYKVNSITLLN